MSNHPHLGGDTRIFVLSSAFCLNHPQSPAFCLMEKNYPDKHLSWKKRQKLAIDRFKCDQSN